MLQARPTYLSYVPELHKASPLSLELHEINPTHYHEENNYDYEDIAPMTMFSTFCIVR